MTPELPGWIEADGLVSSLAVWVANAVWVAYAVWVANAVWVADGDAAA